MDLERARVELGVSGELTKDTLKRAYLKNVRLHPPERDAEGFQRVREAYEALLAAPWAWSSAPSAAIDAEDPPWVTRKSASTDPPSPSATDVVPQPPSSHPSPALDPTDDDLLVEATTGSASLSFSERVEELVEEGHAEAAAVLLFDFDEQPAGLAEPPSLSTYVELSLSLFAQGKLTSAHEVFLLAKKREAMARGYDRGGLIAVRLKVASELAALISVGDKRLIRVLATRIQSGDYESAIAFAQSECVGEDATFVRKLQRAAPTLFGNVPAPQPDWKRPSQPWWSRWGAGMFILMIVRGLASGFSSCGSSERPRVEVPRYQYEPPPKKSPTTHGVTSVLDSALLAVDEGLESKDCALADERLRAFAALVGQSPTPETLATFNEKRLALQTLCATPEPGDAGDP